MPTYKFKVTMSCGGCSGAVTRILQKTEGVQNFDVSLETQLVTVTTDTLTQDQVFEAVKKSGKATEIVPS
ncbi:heavy metal-associated domain-containing protein [Geranomyces variabilis]|nr:heavy metal-associated domain-containing protein [Geranomyces variabilis]KAJ3136680.1 Cytosolic copper metallochaperone [Geranomyces variabilis]